MGVNHHFFHFSFHIIVLGYIALSQKKGVGHSSQKEVSVFIIFKISKCNMYTNVGNGIVLNYLYFLDYQGKVKNGLKID